MHKLNTKIQKKVAFFETKNTSEITVVSHQHEHVRDALLLARDKFGVVLVFGTDEFKKQVQQIADSEDIKIEFKTTAQQKVNAAIEKKREIGGGQLSLFDDQDIDSCSDADQFEVQFEENETFKDLMNRWNNKEFI